MLTFLAFVLIFNKDSKCLPPFLLIITYLVIMKIFGPNPWWNVQRSKGIIFSGYGHVTKYTTEYFVSDERLSTLLRSRWSHWHKIVKKKPPSKRSDFETLCTLEMARHRHLPRKMSLASGWRETDRVLCFVDHASLYNLVNRTNLVHKLSYYVYCFSLHVSGNYVPIIRRKLPYLCDTCIEWQIPGVA